MEFEFQGIQVSNKHNDFPAVIAKRALAGIDGKYPYSLVDFEVTLKVRRSQNNNDRLFRQVLLTLKLPEFEKLWERRIPVEIEQGEETGKAKYICGSLGLDFVEPRDAHLEIVFSDGDEFVGSTVVPVRFESLKVTSFDPSSTIFTINQLSHENYGRLAHPNVEPICSEALADEHRVFPRICRLHIYGDEASSAKDALYQLTGSEIFLPIALHAGKPCKRLFPMRTNRNNLALRAVF